MTPNTVRFSRFHFRPVKYLGKNDTRITACRQHLALSRQIATEGTVLLKNDGVLPLKQGTKLCVFGRAAGQFLFGGGGSGDVYTNIRISLVDALREAEKSGRIELFHPLIEYAEEQAELLQQAFVPDPRERWKPNRDLNTILVPEDLYKRAVDFGGIAIFTLLRCSTESTLDGDRWEKGDFTMTAEEQTQFAQLCRDFEKVIVIPVTCGPVSVKEFAENDKVGALLYPLYGGSYAGPALVDILLGDSYPSGHLQDTLACNLSDYPGADTFYDSTDYVKYTEDIFVGYRWFETFCPEKVVYPFGYGLGYTTFRVEKEAAKLEKNTVFVDVRVTNTGSFKGKEVVQLYLSAPQGKLGKAKKVLAAFQKTRELKPGESQLLKLHFDLREFASFDDLGKIDKSCFILEKGEYTVSMGTNVREAAPVLSCDWAEDTVVRRCHSYLAPDPKKLERRLCADGSYERLLEEASVKHPPRRYFPKGEAPDPPISANKATWEDRTDEFLLQLNDYDLASLLHGHNDNVIAQTCSIGIPRAEHFRSVSADPKWVPMIPTCDGPAGLRVAHRALNISTTFFPVGNTLSQTWNLPLAQKMGKAAALEIKENNCGIWLAPALNIHRNPLCGRNFEYFSEDPLISGLFAAAVVKGTQGENIAATIKHFCCNNKEINRKWSDSRVSQRALREIYLRGFEICVKKADPWCLMTSYNLVNGERCSGAWELINGILKGEWKYPGLVMTDWRTASRLEDDLLGGCDVRMPYRMRFPDGCEPEIDVEASIKDGTIDRNITYEVARRFLHLLSHLE